MSADSEIIAFQEGRIAELEDSLQFVERWAVHHGTKSHMTAENALSIIQHYPPIAAITKSYADGKVPETFNPYARITELQAQLEAAQKDAERYQWLRNDCGNANIGVYRDPHQQQIMCWLIKNNLDAAIDAAIAEGKA